MNEQAALDVALEEYIDMDPGASYVHDPGTLMSIADLLSHVGQRLWAAKVRGAARELMWHRVRRQEGERVR